MTTPVARLTDQASDLLAQCVEANVRAATSTTNALLASKDAELASLGRAFADLYDTLAKIPDHSRSVAVDRLLRGYAGTRAQVEDFYLNPAGSLMADLPDDPRLAAVAADLMSVYGWTQGAPIDHAAHLLAAADAADEASGVRRVRITAADVPHIARKSDLADGPSQALCGAPVTSAVEQEGPVCGLCVLIYERAEALGWLPPLAGAPGRGCVVTGEQDHAGEPTRQLLAEISQRIELGNERQDEDTGDGDAVLSAWSMFAVVARQDTPRLVAALTAVLDLAAKARHGALRWADPLPVPEWVDQVEAAIVREVSS